MELKWDINKEFGFLEIIPRTYGIEYFNKYVRYANTPMGKELTQRRIIFIDKWHNGKLLDVGIGSGQFVMARENTFGYDINPFAVEVLKKINRYADIKDNVFPAYSFFDSFEHIRD